MFQVYPRRVLTCKGFYSLTPKRKNLVRLSKLHWGEGYWWTGWCKVLTCCFSYAFSEAYGPCDPALRTMVLVHPHQSW